MNFEIKWSDTEDLTTEDWASLIKSWMSAANEPSWSQDNQRQATRWLHAIENVFWEDSGHEGRSILMTAIFNQKRNTFERELIQSWFRSIEYQAKNPKTSTAKMDHAWERAWWNLNEIYDTEKKRSSNALVTEEKIKERDYCWNEIKIQWWTASWKWLEPWIKEEALKHPEIQWRWNIKYRGDVPWAILSSMKQMPIEWEKREENPFFRGSHLRIKKKEDPLALDDVWDIEKAHQEEKKIRQSWDMLMSHQGQKKWENGQVIDLDGVFESSMDYWSLLGDELKDLWKKPCSPMEEEFKKEILTKEASNHDIVMGWNEAWWMNKKDHEQWELWNQQLEHCSDLEKQKNWMTMNAINLRKALWRAINQQDLAQITDLSQRWNHCLSQWERVPGVSDHEPVKWWKRNPLGKDDLSLGEKAFLNGKDEVWQWMRKEDVEGFKRTWTLKTSMRVCWNELQNSWNQSEWNQSSSSQKEGEVKYMATHFLGWDDQVVNLKGLNLDPKKPWSELKNKMKQKNWGELKVVWGYRKDLVEMMTQEKLIGAGLAEKALLVWLREVSDKVPSAWGWDFKNIPKQIAADQRVLEWTMKYQCQIKEEEAQMDGAEEPKKALRL